jgi:hypothetical protein
MSHKPLKIAYICIMRERECMCVCVCVCVCVCEGVGGYDEEPITVTGFAKCDSQKVGRNSHSSPQQS